MRRGRILIYLALIIILGSVTGYLLLQRNVFQRPSEETAVVVEPEPVIETMEVVVVTQNTPRGTILNETLLATIEIPKNDAISGLFFSDMAAVVNRRAKFDLDSGIPLTASMLVDSADALSATGSLAALNIPRGQVAVSIPISRLSSVSYAPRPGDHVSVIVTMMLIDIDSEYQTRLPNEFYPVIGPVTNEETNVLTLNLGGSQEIGDTVYSFQGRTEMDPLLNELMYILPQERQRPRLVSQILLADATVLRVGDFDLKDEPEEVPAGEGAEEAVEPPVPEGEETVQVQVPPDVITLIVSPQDAVTLNYLMVSKVQMTLALRATGDDTVFSTESATLQFILDEYNITLPAKLPYSLEPRLDNPHLPTLRNDVPTPE